MNPEALYFLSSSLEQINVEVRSLVFGLRAPFRISGAEKSATLSSTRIKSKNQEQSVTSMLFTYLISSLFMFYSQYHQTIQLKIATVSIGS